MRGGAVPDLVVEDDGARRGDEVDEAEEIVMGTARSAMQSDEWDV